MVSAFNDNGIVLWVYYSFDTTVRGKVVCVVIIVLRCGSDTGGRVGGRRINSILSNDSTGSSHDI